MIDRYNASYKNCGTCGGNMAVEADGEYVKWEDVKVLVEVKEWKDRMRSRMREGRRDHEPN